MSGWLSGRWRGLRGAGTAFVVEVLVLGRGVEVQLGVGQSLCVVGQDEGAAGVVAACLRTCVCVFVCGMCVCVCVCCVCVHVYFFSLSLR